MTPNPNAMKFVSNKLLIDGFVEVKSREESAGVPLAQAIFTEFDFAKEVFVSDNFVASNERQFCGMASGNDGGKRFYCRISQTGGEISTIEAQKHENPVEKIINRDYTDNEQKISDILNEYVAPAVENDGGKISLMEYDESTKNRKNAVTGSLFRMSKFYCNIKRWNRKHFKTIRSRFGRTSRSC